MSTRLEPLILRLHAEGVKGTAIAAEVGCSAAYVSQTLRQAGLGKSPPIEKPEPRWSAERVEQAKSLWLAGNTAAHIAKVLGHGISRNAVIGRMYRMGLKFERPSDPQKAERKAARPKASPRPRKRLLIAGKNAVFSEPKARKPWVIVPEKAWHPLPGSAPRPWTERGFGCKWPIDIPGAAEQHACCEPKDPEQNYCQAHRQLGRSRANDTAAKGNDYVRSLRKYAA